MIRERISTRGVVRPLEPEAELTAFRLPRELVCDISELALRRYVDGAARLARKFGKAAKAIEKERARNLERARAEDATLDAGRLRSVFSASTAAAASVAADAQTQAGAGASSSSSAGSSWAWAWALDEDEHPPPSSIVSRRDTEEARRLARIADQAVFADGSTVNANSLWSLIVNFLTTTPERGDAAHKHKHGHEHSH